jgi:hypothetical protein
MPSGYSRSTKIFKGALIELSEEYLSSVPNIIVFTREIIEILHFRGRNH